VEFHNNINVLEKDIQHAVMSYLEMQGFFVWKSNSVGLYDPVHKVFRKQKVKGISDLTAISPNGIVFFPEIKRPSGKQGDNQKRFQHDIESHNGNYRVIRSTEEMAIWIREFKLETVVSIF
jgi:hypothetical protein